MLFECACAGTALDLPSSGAAQITEVRCISSTTTCSACSPLTCPAVPPCCVATLAEQWPQVHEQHDVAEMLSFLHASNPFACVQGDWESRLLIDSKRKLRIEEVLSPFYFFRVPRNYACNFWWRTGCTSSSVGRQQRLSLPQTSSAFRCCDTGQPIGSAPGSCNIASCLHTEYYLCSGIFHIGQSTHMGHIDSIPVLDDFTDWQSHIQRGAVHPALHVHDDNRNGASADAIELEEICCNCYLFFYRRVL